MEHNVKRGATTFIQCIAKQGGVTVSQHPEQYLPEGIHSDSGCNQEAIVGEKKSLFSFWRMDIDKQIGDHVGHCLL